MQFIRKYIILLFLLAFPGIYALAQEEEEYYDSLLIEQVKVENPVYKPVIGIGIGVFNFFGDAIFLISFFDFF